MAETYKCPGCGAALVYKEGTESLVCPYCGTQINIKAAAKTGTKVKVDSVRKTGKEKTQSSEQKEERFNCSSCGAELETTEYTASTVCPYCSSPAVLTERLKGKRRPVSLIPFKIGRDEVKNEYFRKWAKSGLFTPASFFSSTNLDKVQGMYVPFYLFDYHCGGTFVAEGEKVHYDSDSDYDYVYHDHYKLVRTTEADYTKIPADASEVMPDDTMDRLEPFDYQELRDFDDPFLSGYEAEMPNFSASELAPRAKARARDALESQTRGTMMDFSSVKVVERDVKSNLLKHESTMIPVWVLQYRYRDKDYNLYINAQTGRRIGVLPVDPLKVFACFVLSSAVIFFLAALVWYLLLL